MNTVNVPPRADEARPALARWRARLGLETGGPDWTVGPPAPLSPPAELALLAIRELRRTLQTDLAVEERAIAAIIAPRSPPEMMRSWFRAIDPAPSGPTVDPDPDTVASADTALALWHRELREHKRSTTTFDPLWISACATMQAREAQGTPHLAARWYALAREALKRQGGA